MLQVEIEIHNVNTRDGNTDIWINEIEAIE